MNKLGEYKSPVGITYELFQLSDGFSYPYAAVCDEHGEIEFAEDHDTAVKVWTGRGFCQICRELEEKMR